MSRKKIQGELGVAIMNGNGGSSCFASLTVSLFIISTLN